MINERQIEEVLARADIIEVIGEYISLKKKGVNYEACCPFHNEKTPSFIVNPRRGTWFCYGACQQGGNVFKFLMKYDNISFPEAVLKLAHKYGIVIEDNKQILTAEQEKTKIKREAMYVINAKAQEFYSRNLLLLTDDNSKFVQEYITKRWGNKFPKEIGIGYATSDWDNLYLFSQKEGLSIELMLQLGLLKKSVKGKIYDFYRGRIVIPIRDRFRRTIGFTARDITGDTSAAKYINSNASDAYDKENSIFGIDVAMRQGIKEDKFYLVEGAPDVLRLQSLNINNTIASLGSSWSKHQFDQIKKLATKVCFIPDADPPKDSEFFGTGVKAVCKNGLLALKQGLAVSVKELPCDSSTKNDPDSYIVSKTVLENLNEEDFIIWYANKIFTGKKTTEELSAGVAEVSGLIASIKDEVKESMYLQQLQALYKNKSLWKIAIDAAKKKNKEEKKGVECKTLNRDLYSTYHFYEENNCYYSLDKEGKEFQWSNFVMEPLFHIKDPMLPKRLFRIKNANNQEEIIELKQEDLVSLSRFKQKVEGMGNYIWLAREDNLTRLKMFLYETTETAIEITQLGWNRKHFYAFGNGIYTTEWHPADSYGIVRLGDNNNYYLPANSKIYRDEVKLFQFERKFVHLNYSGISFDQYCEKLINVFGDNAKIGICFLLATLFKDIITGYTKSFPVLNLFGPKGSGKSELGHSLMSFFIIENIPPNIQNSTIASMADLVAQCANAIVHIDEFKNNIDIDKREFLKGLWDGAGRSRMNMDRDKKREITSVDCGVILSGQEMATADIALFSRLIFLTFNKSEFTDDAKRKFNELTEIRKRGCSHITIQILRHRAKMETEFSLNYKTVLSDLQAALQNEAIEDRILRNWAIPLAAFRTLSGVIDVLFDYKEVLKISIEGIIKQNSECKTNNELANFWNVVAFLQQDGEIWNEADYRIDYVREFKCNTIKDKIIFPITKPILLIRKNRIFMLYKKFGRQVGDTILPEGSLNYYLENSHEYIGRKNSVRFKNIQKGFEQTEIDRTGGNATVVNATTVDTAMCFDYEKLMEKFQVNLEVEKVFYNKVDENSQEIKIEPQQKINF